ncbi:Hypothetical predicted protein [Cloeon dipterum]|uniref:Cytoplasmic dynein 2 heavy chain 1 n=1 Tax=Cloeon dipterum TaxID=197152 RepID=A0A8S1CRE7_9INSE|nr:Hypothetical predicted protein [Cloeon dipterum]
MAVANDFRKKFVLQCIENFFDISNIDDLLLDNAALERFLNDQFCTKFCVRRTPEASIDGHRITFSNEVSCKHNDQLIVFFKTRTEELTVDNLHDVISTATLAGGAVTSFLQTIQNIYIPAIIQGDHKASQGIREALVQLETKLKGEIQEIESVAGVDDVEDEINFWKTVPKSKNLLNILVPFQNDYNMLKGSASLTDVEDMLDAAHDVVDELWNEDNPSFPQNRMENLLLLIANSLVKYLQNHLSNVKLWTESFEKVSPVLSQASAAAQRWIETCNKLTSFYWLNNANHKWSGRSFTPDFLFKFHSRVEEINSIRSVHHHLKQFLPEEDIAQCKDEDAFKMFEAGDSLVFNSFIADKWRSAVGQFEQTVAQLEERVAVKLKSFLTQQGANATQSLYVMTGMEKLFSRPYILRLLTSQRESLLAELKATIDEIKVQMQKQQASLEISNAVEVVKWVKQREKIVSDIAIGSSKFLSDLSGYRSYEAEITSLLKSLKELDANAFNLWSRTKLASLSNATLSFNVNEPVVKFDKKSQLMVVTYNPALNELIREARQLAVSGHAIPEQIKKAAEQAKEFVRRAKTLEKVANFHNTIGDRMIPCQRPMMLEAAFALSQLVQKETQVTWVDPFAVDEYIDKMQGAVERLSAQNTLLSGYHSLVLNKVKYLMTTNLLKNQGQWKGTIREIKESFKQVEAKNFSNMKAWKLHWDHQVYKALEFQYILCLESLSEHIPEIRVELVYRQQTLQFQPPFEEIRLIYFNQLKKLLSIPVQFKGIEGTEHTMFANIVERNGNLLRPLYERAEELFTKLKELLIKFEKWVALGSVDLHEMVEQNLHTADDWDKNFKSSKAWAQDIGRFTTLEEKIECFMVSMLAVRAEAEMHNRRFWDILCTSLRDAVTKEAQKIQTFAMDGINVLRQQPASAAELSRATVQYSELLNRTPDMVREYDEARKKNRILANWTRERVAALDEVAAVWQSFQLVLGNREAVIEEQISNIKTQLNERLQELSEDTDKFWQRWKSSRPSDSKVGNAALLKDTFDNLAAKRKEWLYLKEKRDELKSELDAFGLLDTDVSNWTEIETEVQSQEITWNLLSEFQSGIEKFGEEEWIVFKNRTHKFDEFLTEWDQKVEEQISAGHTAPLISHLQKEIKIYMEMSPGLRLMKGDMFSEKQWASMLELVGVRYQSMETLKFREFLLAKDQIVQNMEQIKTLIAQAASEIVIRQALSELNTWEIEARFAFFEHTDNQGKKLMLVQDFKEILSKVGDNQCLLQSIKSSPNFESFKDQATLWENRLAILDECLRNLAQIQRKWLYLEPIFGAGTLASDKARFHRVDVDFRNVSVEVAREKKVISLCRRTGLPRLLAGLIDQLERCQKSLNDFLEEKRSAFPRFYFIGDDDLLEILGQSTKEKVIQAHLKKLFAGIHHVDFSEDKRSIMAIKSLHGEVVQLKRAVHLQDNVELWLGHLCGEMKQTLQELLVKCSEEARKSDSGPNLSNYPSQILCLSEEIQFTQQCEAAITSNRLGNFRKSLKARLDGLTNFVTKSDSEYSTVLILKIRALIMVLIHNIAIVDFLANSKNSVTTDSWKWQKQLRFYQINNGATTVKMVDAEFDYTFEYLGNSPPLVHTPLTDKCYLTLTQAMHMGLGGNPIGPAGTGKTESVKALGGLLGRQVLVFNCDEGIDMKSMTRIFVGLVKCGAWGCFDEFNRLEEATLSAISMQIQAIQSALKSKQGTVTLMGESVELDRNAGIFVTMNPVGKGYKGRQRLPDNLKQLFRPIVMAKPDSELIAEVLLCTEGFQHAADVGRKLVEVFNLAGRLLSQQQHYDWGLRALKTVLHGCGSALKEAKNKAGDADRNAGAEAELAVRALRLNTLSKLTKADSVHFDAVVRDVFPSVALTEVQNEQLVQALKRSYEHLQLVENHKQIKKCLELFEQLQQRMGVVIVGPTGSGKTTVCCLLSHALSQLGLVVRQHTINPKAMPRAQLLGFVDPDTRQWNDGVLTVSAQQVYNEPLEISSWIVCDGDIDPEWVESLNSVLDDNRLLTLPSGWRIQFGPNVNFLFETHDLSHASPATISRMGMILMSEDDVDLKHLVAVWKRQKLVENEPISDWLDDFFFKAVDWIRENSEFVVAWSTIGMVRTGLSQMIGIKSKSHFTVALIKGLGSNLTETSRLAFATQVFEWIGESMVDPERVLLSYYNELQDCVDTHYSEDLEKDQTEQIVLTAYGKSILDHLDAWFREESTKPFLLVGPPGCGKNALLQHYFSQKRSIDVAEIHCSAQITPHHVLQKLKQVTIITSSISGRVIRPKNAEHLVLYLRDLNLAKPDNWGTNMLISFLQQIHSYRGYFDNLEWVGVEGIQFIGTMTNSNKTFGLSPRFMSLVAVLAMRYADHRDLQHIYGSLLGRSLSDTLPELNLWHSSGKLGTLTDTMIHIYTEAATAFTPMQQSHYLINPFYLTKWCENLRRYSFSSGADLVDSVLLALVHEVMRLFGDMLTTTEERDKLELLVRNSIEDKWNKSSSHIMEKLKHNFFVSLGASSKDDRKANNLGRLSCSEWSVMVDKFLNQYAKEEQGVEIVVTQDFLQSVARIDRVLSAPRGSLLLCGKAGSGRKTAARLVSLMHGSKLISLNVTADYTTKSFKKELKTAIHSAAFEGEQVNLLIEDYQLVRLDFLDLVNSLLASGEIPGLYSNEELESLMGTLREMASQDGFIGSLTAYFAERVKNNLHVILVMDSSDPNLVQNCESNPAIYKLCSIQWNDYWLEQSMTKISQHLLTTSSEVIKEDDEIHSHVISIHKSAPAPLTNPYRFVCFARSYRDIFLSKQQAMRARQEKLGAGISKLTEAQEVVKELREKAGLQEKELAHKQAEASAALNMISETMQGANTQKAEMENLKAQTVKENEHLASRKKEIDLELAEIEPLVQEAQAAVGNIKTESLSEIRSLRAPPEVIRDILEGVLRLMGIQDTSWNSMKIFLAKRGVKEDIKTFNARNISLESREAVEKLLRSKKESFDQKNAKRASVAAAPLASWVIANVKYAVVLEKIRPLEREQDKLQRNMNDFEANIGKISSDLTSVNERVAELKVRLNTFTKEAAEIEIHLTKAKDTLKAAESLVGKLIDEYERWKIQLQELSVELKSLPAKALLAAAFVVYLPGLPEEERRRALDSWKSVLQIEEFSIQSFMASEQQIMVWLSQSLPSDTVSIENAIATLNSKIRPLIIDPTSEALEWIQNNLKQQTVEVLHQNNERFCTLLELAVRFGKVLVIPDVDFVCPVIVPLLKEQYIFQGARCMIKIGDKLVDYNKDFKLFLVSRNTSPEICPTAAAALTMVNFSTTQAGLSGQLLGCALKHDKPELEVRRGELLREEEKMRTELEKLQENLLVELSSAQGDLLENKELLNSLRETKASSIKISDSLTESDKLKMSLHAERELYRPLAEFAGRLYFAVAKLTAVNVIYNFSVSFFVKLFNIALEQTDIDEETGERIESVKRRLIQLVFDKIGRALFKSDIIMFSMHAINAVNTESTPEEEWHVFIGKATGEVIEVDVPSWISSERRSQVQILLSSLPNIAEIVRLEEPALWKPFMDSSECETNFPQHTQSLSLFQRVLVVQALRPDRLRTAMILFAQLTLNISDIFPSALSLKKLLSEAQSTEPILLLSLPGTDPSIELKSLACNTIGQNAFHEVALGEGQIESAEAMLVDASREGHWLCLKNLHLVCKWLPSLEAKLKALQPHADFRLWLTCQPNANLPPVFLKLCLKVVYEAPQGIKRNMHRTFAGWGRETIEAPSKQPVLRAQLLFALAWLHAVLLERAVYVPQGWSEAYDFSDADLKAATGVIEPLIASGGNIKWDYIYGLFENVVYGGRIKNEFDMKVLSILVREFISYTALSGRNSFGPGVELPNSTKFTDALNFISKLPEQDNPEYLSLPSNINSSWQRVTSQKTIDQLMQLSRSSFISKIDMDKWDALLTPMFNLWKKVNQGAGIIQSKIPNDVVAGSPVEQFCALEWKKAVSLVQKIHKTLAALMKVVRGALVPSREISQLAISIISHQTPNLWLKDWEGPSEPLQYATTVVLKAQAIQNWMTRSKQGVLLKENLNLSELLHAENFLIALKQQTARQFKLALVDLQLTSSLTGQLAAAHLSVRVSGLFIEGANFQSGMLTPVKSHFPALQEFPSFYVAWLPKQATVSSSQHHVSIPIYQSVSRENFISSLELPFSGQREQWLCAAVALFLQAQNV